MRNYRIVRIAHASHYESAMDPLYARHPDLDSLPYARQQEVLFGAGLSYSDAFSRALRALGHEAHELVHDLEPMQRAWAREQGLSFESEDWSTRILLEQLRRLKPDVVYCQGYYPFPRSLGVDLKRECPSVRVLVVYAGFPVAVGFSWIPGLDLLPAATPDIEAKYRAEGLPTCLQYHAFDHTIPGRLPTTHPARDIPFSFAGSSGYGPSMEITHLKRYWFLVELMKKSSLEAWVYEPDHAGASVDSRTLWVSDQAARLGYRTLAAVCRALGVKDQPMTPGGLRAGLRDARRVALERRKLSFDAEPSTNLRPPPLPLARLFPRRCHAPVFGLDMYQVLRRSKIAFNRHTNMVDGYAGNLRLFEATGLGACLITEAARNLADLFAADADVVTYTGVAECAEKVRYLMEHEPERTRLAEAGRTRTLRDHTIVNRCRQLDERIQALLARASARTARTVGG